MPFIVFPRSPCGSLFPPSLRQKCMITERHFAFDLHDCHIPYITYRGHQFALQHRSLLLDICGCPKQLGPPRLLWVVGLTPGLACSCLRQKEQLRLQCKVSNISEYHRRQSHDRFNVHWDSLVPGIPQRQLRHFMAVLGSSASVANPCLGTSLDG